jgi:hypothetical protein
MSGGKFEYQQYQLLTIAEDIESVIGKNKKPIEKRDRWGDSDDRKFYYDYPEEIIAEFERAVHCLKLSYIYAQRIDYLLSGDDGEESFLRRLKDEISKL